MKPLPRLFIRISSLLVMMLLVSSVAFAFVDACIWYSNGCFVTVIQYSWGFWDIGWEMFISCYFPTDGGYWSGSGTWGGECNGPTFPVM